MVFFYRVLFFVLLVFFMCSVEESYGDARRGTSRRRGRKDTEGGGGSKQGQVNALKEVKEGMKENMLVLHDEMKALSALVEATLPHDCWAARMRGIIAETTKVNLAGVCVRDVMCDQVREGGGWTVILRRHPTTHNHTHRQDFNRTWTEYKQGFGNATEEYWIGNDILHSLTSRAPHQLLVVLEDWNREKAMGLWNYFMVGSETENYRLSVQEYDTAKSSIGDSFHNHHTHAFSTHDRDNDTHDREHCAQDYGGGWWYFRCHMSHLTGRAVRRGEGGPHAITWRTWTHTTGLRSAYMAIRPKERWDRCSP